MKLTVLIVADFGYVEGGAAKMALDSVRLLHENGYNVILFCGSERIDGDIKSLGIRIVNLGQPELKANPSKLNAMTTGLWNRKSEKALHALLSELDRENTVVHIHSWTKILSPSVFRVLRKSGFKTFITCHDYFLVCPNGAFYDYVKCRVCKRRGGSFGCLVCNCDARNYVQKVWRWIRQRIVTRQLARFENLRALLISDKSQSVLSSCLPPNIRRVRLNNPMRFTEAQASTGAGDEFFFVGRIAPEKAPELFARAVVECGVRGVMVGDGPDLDRIKAAYPQIEYTGWQPPDAVQSIVRERAAAFVFTSVLYEAAPLTPLEMMSLGVPCIISDVTSAAEYIEDGVTGLLFKSNDVEDLKAKIRKFSDADYRRRVVENIRNRFDRSRWSAESHMAGLAKTYKGIL